jgi:hypothetical protein
MLMMPRNIRHVSIMMMATSVRPRLDHALRACTPISSSLRRSFFTFGRNDSSRSSSLDAMNKCTGDLNIAGTCTSVGSSAASTATPVIATVPTTSAVGTDEASSTILFALNPIDLSQSLFTYVNTAITSTGWFTTSVLGVADPDLSAWWATVISGSVCRPFSI